MATIRKRNNRWQAQVRRVGRKPISRTFLQKSDALAWAREREIEADRQELTVDTRALRGQTVEDLVQRYLAEVTPSKKSAEAETYVLRAFTKHSIAKYRLSELDAAMFRKYRDDRLMKISDAGLKRELNSIRHVFSVAISEWGVPLAANPVSSIKPKSNDNRRERRLKEGEFERLLQAARTKRNPLIERVIVFAIESAMRRGEILALRWDQVDFERRSVAVLESKNGYSRQVILTDRAFALVHLCEGCGDFVFPITANALRLAWVRLTTQAGIDNLRFHDLRHEAISRFFEMGLTVPEVASISGHRDFRVLQRYAHASSKHIKSKINSINSNNVDIL